MPRSIEQTRRQISIAARDQAPVHTVHAGNWQAARTTGAYTLVGCTVGPGFDFQDFTMLSDAPDKALEARTAWPEAAGLL